MCERKVTDAACVRTAMLADMSAFMGAKIVELRQSEEEDVLLLKETHLQSHGVLLDLF